MPQELASSSYLICAIGDSRTYGAGASIGHDPVTLLAERLHVMYPSATFIVNNQGVNGTTSEHWLHSALISDALAAFHAHAASRPVGTAVYVQIMLGVNDASGFGFGRCPLPKYLSQMNGIVERIREAGLPGFAGVVLQTSFYAVPYGFAPEIDDACLAEVQRFNAELHTLVNDTDVFMGDQEAYRYFEKHPELMFDKLHASNEGNAELAILWARAYEQIFTQELTAKAS